MNSSTRPDINYYSIFGMESFLIPSYIFDDVFGLETYASALKISTSDCVLNRESMHIPSGYENAVDINNSTNVRLEGSFGSVLDVIPPDQVITIKASANITIVGRIKTPVTKRKAHVQVGNWSDQSYRPCKNVNLTGLYHLIPNEKVKVAVGWAYPFSTRLSKEQEYLIWESLKLKLYWIAKFTVRQVLRIKKNTKGPSWL